MTVCKLESRGAKCEAITEMVPDLIWAPDFFGPQEIWAPRNLKNLSPA